MLDTTGLVTRKGLALLFGIKRNYQRIDVYVNRGMPVAGKLGGQQYYDPEKCLAWKKEYIAKKRIKTARKNMWKTVIETIKKGPDNKEELIAYLTAKYRLED